MKSYSLIKRLGWRSHCLLRGFGLVELMVVIVIIGILAGILLPGQELIVRPSRQSILASADREIAKMDWQEMAYSAPERMEIGSTSNVSVVLGGNKTFAELVALVEKAGQTGGQKVKVSNRMSAHLSGSGFEITADTSVLVPQIVSTIQPTTWQWQVKAKDIGIQELQLTLNVWFVVDGKDAVKSVPIFQKKISVQVTSAAGSWAFMERYWKYIATLLTAVLIPLIVFLWKRFFTRANTLNHLE